ncbi:uncharacterized protein LOC128875526 isoform X1 [Hylaeus volcanicus]|uniref:uncharacterized protein LOC128875526 isoform X1 n=1 Tax=Hylaeus volcanicus TaxID=313075 RepID=UPI0023B86EEA|nr:uncharacterized protein LOC128875526 isoform X1 [Hylaeus volcanicus]
MGTAVPWLILLQLSSALVHGYDTAEFDGWYQPVPHRPVDIITDVINDLGVRILQQYTGHGNVAFSPTGVGFVLAALYEGSAGRGRQQIADALGLPRDKDITRLGFRDIHRRLRTYLNADGFLGGLTLNQENTRLRPEYEDILRFYGFDLSVPEDEANETTTVPETTMTDQPATETTPVQDETTILATESTQESTSEPMTSTTPAVELIGRTMSTADVQDRLTQQTTSATTILTDSTTPATLASQPTTVSLETSPMTPETPTVTPSDAATTTAATVQPTIQSPSTTEPAQSTLMSTTLATTPGTPVETTVTTTVPDSMTTTMTMPTTVSTTITTMMPMDATMPADSGMVPSSSNQRLTQANQTMSGSTSGPAADENTVLTGTINNQTASSEMGSTDTPGTTAVTGETGSNGQPATASSTVSARRRKRGARSPRGFFSSYPDEGIWMQDLGIWKPYSTSLGEASVRDSTEISFLVNGCDVSSVTATRYFAVLPFAYFPSLHAVALEFPLDDPRYNILLLMATDRRDTYRLARDLGGKSLRLLRKQLQATWVRATIPSFMLRGFVTLTSFLQRLGIADVFEPRAADLSLMTPDLGVYARDVQQSIGVNIRNYMKPDRTHSRESPKSDPPLIVPPRRDYYRYYHPGNGLFERAGPVPFTAVHPFLYFIVDAETSVALIAGRVNDPLNSRIL